MKQFEARVHFNRDIARDYFEMEFAWPDDTEAPSPGQFVSIKSIGTADLILRRPFAVASFDRNRGMASIIYQRRGKATSMLAVRLPGDSIDLVGPLGNTFPVDENLPLVLVGGGVGLGPVLYFGNWLVDRGFRPTVVLGFREAAYVPAMLRGTGSPDAAVLSTRFEPVVCTDDGSLGYHGTTVDWLHEASTETPGRFGGANVHACGPNAMMAACSAFCEERGLRCWVSMEQVMGCGVGACVGCAIPVTDGSQFARVCTEGPVFESRQIAWEQMQ